MTDLRAPTATSTTIPSDEVFPQVDVRPSAICPQGNPHLLCLDDVLDWVVAADALGVYHNTKVSMSHLELVTGLSEEFESDFGGGDQAFNKHSYLWKYSGWPMLASYRLSGQVDVSFANTTARV